MKNLSRAAAVVATCAVLGAPSLALADSQIVGAGSTFDFPFFSRAFFQYESDHPGVTVNYQSIGSGGGIQQFTARTVDFGASDVPLSSKEMKAAVDANGPVIQVPVALGGVAVAYNVPGAPTHLHLSASVLADMYLGKITNWNDGNIQHDNPGVKLPDHKILPVYRSDGSGTNYIWTDFLSKVVPAFQQEVGKGTSVKWPLGIGQKGNEGVAGMVRSSPYSFGYVELIYALQNHMSFGLVRNASGKYVKASVEGVTEAAAGAAKNMPADYRVSITNAPGADSYPISSFTWLLIPQQWQDQAKGKAMVDFLNWMLDHGEQETTGLNYAPLPKAVAEKVRATIKEIH